MNDTYITLNGWVGSDVSLRDVGGGSAVANFRVATTSRRFRNDQWEDGTTTWYSVKAWRRLADNVAASIGRGDPVVVHGKLEADVWTKPDGSTSTQLVVTATSVGHDLSRGTAVFTRPARPGSVTGQEQQAVSPDPWAALSPESAPSFAQDPGEAPVAPAAEMPEADAA
ncbi:single-stranded DNA-binding protein [Nocardioides currus]|uniref:Single-stranded DNA-binding protein n=1 Tax=Nocardioides currus TaxID=2133958 RepID=A0A2R7YX49_9ACTN|nr:single-stranded DNA-binding protein [Nocardioides currus]PUA80970.1 single-stranded DNA-binding protein [Nocardioides currus]